MYFNVQERVQIIIVALYDSLFYVVLWGTGMEHWGERFPPTTCGPGSKLDLVLVWGVGSRLAPRVSSLVLRFSSLHKNQHLQISLRSGNTGQGAPQWDLPLHI